LQTVDILGVNIACLDLPGLLEAALAWSREQTRRTIYYANAHCLNLALDDLDYRQALNRADLIYADGISVVWSSRFLGGCRLHRLTGADWVGDFCALAEQNDLRLYILAGQRNVARQAKDSLLQRYPGIKIVGVVDGLFEDQSPDQVLEDIARSSPHVLMVGMGSPRQEIWIARNREQIAAPLCWGVGALFDFVAQVEPRSPTWMIRLGLEWAWRLLVNPRGKWRRYLLGNPRFVYRVVRQKLAGFDRR
jgi:N-acetylglucosaminyldiphosphoundecaprenol N-acetyl-beta-D-mannosaminyltransferase